MFSSPLGIHVSFLFEETLMFVKNIAVSQNHIIGKEHPDFVIIIILFFGCSQCSNITSTGNSHITSLLRKVNQFRVFVVSYNEVSQLVLVFLIFQCFDNFMVSLTVLTILRSRTVWRITRVWILPTLISLVSFFDIQCLLGCISWYRGVFNGIHSVWTANS